MMMKPSTHKNYTAADIQRYHSGLMSVEEMHELEKSSLEDPLLSDAIDGFENKNNIDNDLVELREKLHKRNFKKGGATVRKLFTSISIAASVLVIFSIAYFMIKKPENKQIQLSTNDIKPTQKVPSDLDEKSVTKRSSETQSASSIAEIKSEKKDEDSGGFKASDAEELASILKNEEKKFNSKIIETNNISPNANSSAKAAKIQTENVAVTNKQLNEVAAVKAMAYNDDEIANSDSKKETVDNKINSSDKNVATDSVNSFATIKTEDEKVYATATVAAPATSYIATNTDMQMQEVVVSGYNNKSKKSLSASTQKIASKDINKTKNSLQEDMSAFEDYLNNQKPVCQYKNGNDAHGKVSLKFNINKKGRPEKIKVNQSLNVTCDNEAIRLLNEGPDWNGSKQKKAVVVNISF